MRQNYSKFRMTSFMNSISRDKYMYVNIILKCDKINEKHTRTHIQIEGESEENIKIVKNERKQFL